MIKVRDAILYHSLGESQSVKSIFGKFNTSNHSALRRYYMTRNRFYTWEKYKDLNSFTNGEFIQKRICQNYFR